MEQGGDLSPGQVGEMTVKVRSTASLRRTVIQGEHSPPPINIPALNYTKRLQASPTPVSLPKES